jgi:hypothetical protein
MMVRALCLCCGGVSEFDDDAPPVGCPHCRCTKHVPADLNMQEQITITAHELSVLTHWADNWARGVIGMSDPHSQQLVRGIVDRLVPQVKSSVGLTFQHEVNDLRASYPELTIEATQFGQEL